MSLSEMDLEVTVASLRGDYQNMFGHDAGFDDLKDDLRTVVIAEHTANALESKEPAGMWFTSSKVTSPTSPIHASPVSLSKLHFHGWRKP